ncbi:MAG: nickel pincer cofactor biosynthesis protein LarB [Bacteroidales bacterium]|nr:nickel pincer cofactor biosynthesis protein LarB [Bacteroidales bacterium]
MKQLEDILEQYRRGVLALPEAVAQLSGQSIADMGIAVLDMGRRARTGIPEVIYAGGKTVEQVRLIAQRMYEQRHDILATRVTPDMATAILEIVPDAVYHPLARAVSWNMEPPAEKGRIAIVAAGTSDMPVAEEAAITARFLGNRTETFYDVGVAGIHRLFARIEAIRQARVIIVIAGMEGALASVVGGMVDKPVIGVPSSVGYGANLGGIAALLSMLNSCAAGVSVVNIDNGFGAACQASLINQLTNL